MALSPRDRNALIVLGVIVVAALAFFFLFMGGGDEPDDAAPTVPPPTNLPEPTPSPEPGGERPRRFSFFGGRDPFLPLVVSDEGTGGAGTTDATTGGTGTGTGTGTVDEPDDDAEQDAQGDDGATTTVGGHRVTLVSIVDGNTAQISVDGETFTVDEGEEFGDNFRLVSVSGGCARILHGDESFTLCEGGERK